jgi:competence protein ComEC
MNEKFPPSSSLPSSYSSMFRHGQLFLLVGACLGGQVSAAYSEVFFSPPWLAGLGLLVCLVWWFAPRHIVLLTLCSLVLYAFTYVSLQQALHPNFPPHHLRHRALPQDVTVEGWLFREPEQFPHRGRLYLETQCVWKDGAAAPAAGKILLTVRSLLGSWQYGDVVRVPLKLRRPRNFHTPGSFDYEGYLARQDIYLTAFLWDDRTIERVGTTPRSIQHRIEDLRRNLGAFFSARLDPQVAAVLRALILGDQGLIDNDLRQAFAQAGVTHVLSISGLHIALVAATAYGGWWWVLSRSRRLLLSLSVPKLASILTFPLTLFYAALAGGSVATWRSVIMVFVYLLAGLVDRRGDVYRSLALAALVIAVVEPGAVLDISFQLSFISVFSITLGTERLFSWLGKWQRFSFLHGASPRANLLRWGVVYSAVPVFALFGTAPLTAYHFNQISLAGLVANLIIVPLLGSAAVVFGLLTVVGFFLDSRLAAIFLWLAGLVTRVGNALVNWFATLPYAAFHVVTPSEFELLLLYALLLCFLCRFLLSPLVFRSLAAVLQMGLLADAVWWTSQRYFHYTLLVSFLDVGQGDAAVAELPDGQVMLIDGGGFASQDFDTGEAIIAPFLWSRKIGQVDIVVMSHPQLDHYGGLRYIAEHFSPRELWFNGEEAWGERFANLMETVNRKGIQLRALCREAPPPAHRNVEIHVFHPPCNNTLDTNNASLVLRLSYGTTDMLFTGDIEQEGEAVLLAATSALPSEILKVPHHGSRTSSSPTFVNAIIPAIAIASLGADNRFRFPAQEVVQRYQSRGSTWLRTDQAGTVTVISDGRGYRLVTALPASLQ